MGLKETANNLSWYFEPVFQKVLIPPYLKTIDYLIDRRIIFPVKGAENLQLITDPSASVVFTSTHNQRLKDLAVIEACYIEMSKLGEERKKREEYIGHWSLLHAQSYEDTIVPYSAWVKLLRERRYIMIPVMHAYKGRRVRALRKISENQTPSLLSARDIFKPYGRMFVFVEGHRSFNHNFAVNPAEDITGFLLLMARKRKQPLLVVPTATIPYGLGTYISFGVPRDIDFLEEKANALIQKYQLPQDQDKITLLSQVAMLDLCEQLLPHEMHGMYDPNNPHFLEVMTGQIKLGLVPEGKKEVVKPVRKTFNPQGEIVWQPLGTVLEDLNRSG